MTDFTPTNTKIAVLLMQQTYIERMEMAQAFSDVLNDAKADLDVEDGFDADRVAGIIQSWADGEIEAAEDLS